MREKLRAEVHRQLGHRGYRIADNVLDAIHDGAESYRVGEREVRVLADIDRVVNEAIEAALVESCDGKGPHRFGDTFACVFCGYWPR